MKGAQAVAVQEAAAGEFNRMRLAWLLVHLRRAEVRHPRDPAAQLAYLRRVAAGEGL